MEAKWIRRAFALALPLVGVACSSSDPDDSPSTSASSTAGGGDGTGGESASTGSGGRSGDGGGGGTGGSDDIAEADFPGAFADAICGNVDDCCATEGVSFDAAGCAETMGSVTDRWRPSEKGFATYGASAARACVDAASTLAHACPQPIELFEAMFAACLAKVYVGARQPGESCANDYDCAPPADGVSACPPPGAGSAHPLQCEQFARGGLGDACSATYYPDPYRGGYSMAYRPTTSFDVVMCDVSDGIVCDLSVPEPTCVPLVELDQPCAGTSDCAAGLTCAEPTPGAARRCIPQVALGEPCDPATVAADTCAKDGFCDAETGTCEARRPLGAACDASPACTTQTCMNGVCSDLLANPVVCGGE